MRLIEAGPRTRTRPKLDGYSKTATGTARPTAMRLTIALCNALPVSGYTVAKPVQNSLSSAQSCHRMTSEFRLMTDYTNGHTARLRWQCVQPRLGTRSLGRAQV